MISKKKYMNLLKCWRDVRDGTYNSAFFLSKQTAHDERGNFIFCGAFETRRNDKMWIKLNEFLCARIITCIWTINVTIWIKCACGGVGPSARSGMRRWPTRNARPMHCPFAPLIIASASGCGTSISQFRVHLLPFHASRTARCCCQCCFCISISDWLNCFINWKCANAQTYCARYRCNENPIICRREIALRSVTNGWKFAWARWGSGSATATNKADNALILNRTK